MWSANALFVNYKTVHSRDREGTHLAFPKLKNSKTVDFWERERKKCIALLQHQHNNIWWLLSLPLRIITGRASEERREEEMIRRESFEGKTPERQKMAPQRREEAEEGGRADPRPKMMDADTFMLMVVVVIVFLVGFWCRPFLFLFLSPDSPH